MAGDLTITINHPQRRLEWLEMFGTTSLQVKSITPDFVLVPGFDEPQPVYYVDLDSLTPHQQARLIRHLAVKFNLPTEQVQRSLEEQDIPIPTTDCTLIIKNPHKWLG